MSGRVIQGSFIGGRMRAPPRPAPLAAAQRATAGRATPRAPGPPPPAFVGRSTPVQARSAPGRPPLVHRQSAPVAQPHGGNDTVEIDPAQIGLARGGGSPLPQTLLAKMESAFNADFSAIRVYVGPQATRIGAIAFTTGTDIYFAPGRFQPDSVQGQQLIGHELAHVIQQRSGRARAPGSGVAIVQDRALEAEADRLGMKAAAYRGALPQGRGDAATTPRVPPKTIQRHPVQSLAVARPGVLQRMHHPEFPIWPTAEQIFSQHRDTRQTDLEGKSKKEGRKRQRGKEVFTQVKRRKFVEAGGTSSTGKQRSAGVVSTVKVNGRIISFGENEKAHHSLVFHDIGFKNQRGVKDNFHAEDWSIQSFKTKYESEQYLYNDMDDWLTQSNFPATGNTGQGGKHVISILINYSSCLGCVVTIRQFNSYLKANLGKNQFLLRVKFLRPYDLAQTLKDPDSQAARNFVSAIGGLRKKGIFVRMQSETSATQLHGGKLDKGFLSIIAVNHPGVKRILSDEQYDYLTKTWTDQGANRKGTPSSISFGTTTTTVSVPPIVILPPTLPSFFAPVTPPTLPSFFAPVTPPTFVAFQPGLTASIPNTSQPSSNKKGPPYYCNAPTKGNTRCRKRVAKPGAKCHLH